MTQFKKIPLFGKDSEPSHTSSVMSIILTAIFWLCFLIVSFIIKPLNQKPKYKEVQIVLSPSPTARKAPEPPAPAAPAPAPSQASEAPSAAPTAPAATPQPPKQTAPVTPAAKPAAKTEPKKTAAKPAQKKPAATTESSAAKTKPAQVSEPVYALDPMEAFAQQTSKKKSQEFDWSQFDDDTTEETVQSSPVTPAKPAESSFSGSAGSAASTTANQRQTSTSKETSSKSSSVSSETKNSLGKIASTMFDGTQTAGIQAQSNVKSTVSGTGKVVMEMTDGTQRTLLEPASPIINLSEEAAKTIDSSRKVTIEFVVNENGHVPYGDIEIIPAALLSEIAKREIKDQVSTWRFEAASFTSIAEFEYNIVKR